MLAEVDGSGVAYLRLAGEVDVQARESVLQAILDLFGAGHADVVVDLAGVTFLDSSGIGALVRAYQQAVSVGTGYRVAGAQGGVLRVLDLCGITELLVSGTPAQG